MITRTISLSRSVGDAVAVDILEPDSNRDGFVIYNPTGVLFVKLSKYASPTNFTYRLSANTTLEHAGYTGYVSAIKQNGISDVMITTLL